MIRKIEFDEQGEIIHVYRVKAEIDPHNPDGGVEIDCEDEESVKFHEDMIREPGKYRGIYIYDKRVGLRKKTKEEFQKESDRLPNLPKGFVKKNREGEK